jgi:hypothetical protein
MGIPARRRYVAGRAFIEAAATVLRAVGNLLFHVALDGMPAPARDELRGGFGIGAIGHRIAGVDDVAVRNPGAGLECGEGFEGLQVAIGPATDEQGRVEGAEVPGGQWLCSFSSAPSSMGSP